MFNNLIESSSHKREFKRRGSFFLFTTATYAVLFIAAGVASIYAYDARLEDQNTQLVTMLNPIDLESVQPAPAARDDETPRGKNDSNKLIERAIAMSSVNDPRVAPKTVSAAPNKNLPLPPRGAYIISGRDVDPGPGGTSGPGFDRNTLSNRQNVPAIEVGTPPPPVVVEKPKPRIISKGVITSQALSLPKPAYPQIARSAGVEGNVSVQVLIDEFGKVVSAKAVSGNPMLIPAAQQAAFLARFSPTKLGDQPVKVSGVITYNFRLAR